MAHLLSVLFNAILASAFYILTLLRRMFSSDFGGPYFAVDVFVQLVTLALVIVMMDDIGRLPRAYQTPWQYNVWFVSQYFLTGASWAFGYFGLNPGIYLPHLFVGCLRLVYCGLPLAVFFHLGLYPRTGYLASFFLIVLFMAALLHFKISYDRFKDHRRLQSKTFLNPSDYRMNLMTGESMRDSGVGGRGPCRSQAVDAVTSTTSEERFWYHPLIMMSDEEHSQRRGKGEDGVSTDLGAPHFSRCYCCLDSDPAPQKSKSLHTSISSHSDTELLDKPSQWQEQRELFLRQPPQGHPSIISRPSDAAGIRGLGNEFGPHYLCQKCGFIAENSFLIELQSGWNFSTYRKLLSRAFKREAFVEECFEHWQTPADMELQVRLGCHLCTMVWNTMNIEQQRELLSQDLVLKQELDELSSDQFHSQSQLEEIRDLYHRQRCIRMKIRSPSAHKKWASAWKDRHARTSLRLIPHFGNKVAQRWMEHKLASRAISMEKDPVLDWDEEQDDGLEIACTKLDNRGPIVLPVSYSTGSDSTMNFIRSWLYGDDHFQDDPEQQYWGPIESGIALGASSIGGSRKEAPELQLPTRLVDVGDVDDTFVVYLALSHCWGNGKFLILTESNLSDFTYGISIESLPPTFRDAVSVVRRLGFRFLWVDSLCIIQDSGVDWRREAVRMKDIYSNAECVIAAIASWTSEDSFFIRQTPLAANPCLLGVRGHLTGVNNNPRQTFSGIYALPSLKYTRNSWDDIRMSRLRSRAWCYQEEHLAKKIVYFGDHQILLLERSPSGTAVQEVRQVEWQSERDTSSDAFPNLIQPPIFRVTKLVLQQAVASLTIIRLIAAWRHRWRSHHPDRMSDFPNDSVAPVPGSQLDPEDLLTSQWWAVVTEYSNRFLTQGEDKLLALSGIALRYQSQALHRGLKVHYVAGLWGTGHDDSYLVTGLLWYVSRLDSRGPSLLENPYRAPSWSWASVDGVVRNDSLSGCCLLEYTGISILQHSVEGPDVLEGSQTPFPTGLCNGGFIVVRGMIQKATWDVSPDAADKRYYVVEPGKDFAAYGADDLDDFAPYSSDPLSGPEAYPLLFPPESRIRVGYFIPDVRPGSDVPAEIYCLRIVVKPASRAQQQDFSVPWATRGLALTPTGLTPNEFKRVGYFETDKTLGGLSFVNKFSTSSDRDRGFRSPAPNTDVAGFFAGCGQQEIVIR